MRLRHYPSTQARFWKLSRTVLYSIRKRAAIYLLQLWDAKLRALFIL